MLSKAYLTSHSRMSGSRLSDHTIVVIWVMKIFFVQFFCVFLPPLLISSASVRSIPFLSFIEPPTILVDFLVDSFAVVLLLLWFSFHLSLFLDHSSFFSLLFSSVFLPFLLCLTQSPLPLNQTLTINPYFSYLCHSLWFLLLNSADSAYFKSVSKEFQDLHLLFFVNWGWEVGGLEGCGLCRKIQGTCHIFQLHKDLFFSYWCWNKINICNFLVRLK